MAKRNRPLRAVLALLILLAGLFPKGGLAGSLSWQEAGWIPAGSWIWLTAGDGISLTTGEAGDDLVFEGQTVTAGGGMALIPEVTKELTLPDSGYVTRMDTAEVEFSSVVVKLPGGGYAQVRFGMGWRKGSGFSSLQIETVLLSQEAPAPAPAPVPEEPAPAPAPPPPPESPAAPADQGSPASSGSGAPAGQIVRLQLDNPVAQVNGETQVLDVPPQLLEGRTMVPLRFVAEALGATLTWDAAERRITLATEGRTVILWVDQRRAVIDGRTVELEVAPTMLEGRTMVPLRFAAESLGAELVWNAADRSIVLTTGGGAAPAAAPTGTTPSAPAVGCAFGGTETGLIQTVALTGVNPDYMVIANDCTAWIYDSFAVKLFKVRLSDGQVLAEAKTANTFVAAIQYNPVNDRLYRIDREGQVELFDGTTGAAAGTLTLPRANWFDFPHIVGAAVDPQGGQLFILGSDQIWAVDREGEVRGPISVDAGRGGISGSGAVVRGSTLWLLGQPWNGSPGLAIAVDTATLAVSTPIPVLDGESINFALGSALETDGAGTFYVAAEDREAGPFVAVVKEGRLHQKLFLEAFTGTPLLALSPDGEHLVLLNPGASGTVITEREYTYDGVRETHQLFSVFGSLVVLRTDDLTAVVSSGTEIDQAAPGWFVSDAGKPTAALFSPDGRLLFVSDRVSDEILIYRLRP
ncbi:MAG: stalk domain-containing protein [Bacillota bacterium]